MLPRKPSVAPMVVLGCAALALGCERRSAPPSPAGSATIESAETPPPPTGTSAGAPSALQTPTVQARMTEHFGSSGAMRNALVAGDLPAFRAAAATLADKELSANLSDTWRPHLDAMRAGAARARDAKTVQAAAQGFAEVGRACGACHEQLGGPKVTVGVPPAEASGAKPHMAGHTWAAARLWEGLMGPSQEAWSKGAAVFTAAPLEPEAVAGEKSVPPEVRDLARRAHRLGAGAHAAKDAPARTRAVADVYATCASCHSKLGVSLPESSERP